ncbi:uncharacterized protein LOC131145737 [Malania oleifera]|uniref:uncharacterized protein LOC131145737 n=1 Tax=Malania oleifera TaxID=397392 RepID=UPI0025AE3814|nr:uncharacterized protein LOC131145737 [Malania oleifera]
MTPSAFSGEVDPAAAENWMQEIEKVLVVLQCTEEQKVLFAIEEAERSLNGVGGGVGLILIAPDSSGILYALLLEFATTNNDAEYEALLVKGEFVARYQKMKKYLAKAQEYIKTFTQFDTEYTPRAENAKVDTLARLTSASKPD